MFSNMTGKLKVRKPFFPFPICEKSKHWQSLWLFCDRELLAMMNSPALIMLISAIWCLLQGSMPDSYRPICQWQVSWEIYHPNMFLWCHSSASCDGNILSVLFLFCWKLLCRHITSLHAHPSCYYSNTITAGTENTLISAWQWFWIK